MAAVTLYTNVCANCGYAVVTHKPSPGPLAPGMASINPQHLAANTQCPFCHNGTISQHTILTTT